MKHEPKGFTGSIIYISEQIDNGQLLSSRGRHKLYERLDVCGVAEAGYWSPSLTSERKTPDPRWGRA